MQDYFPPAKRVITFNKTVNNSESTSERAKGKIQVKLPVSIRMVPGSFSRFGMNRPARYKPPPVRSSRAPIIIKNFANPIKAKGPYNIISIKRGKWILRTLIITAVVHREEDPHSNGRMQAGLPPGHAMYVPGIPIAGDTVQPHP